MNHKQHRPLKANEIVQLFANLLGMDVPAVASAVAIPRANLVAWLAGKKENLRMASIVRLFALVGLVIKSGALILDPRRVHFWEIRDGLFTRNAYEPLQIISKMLEGAAITRVEPQRRNKWAQRTHQFYLLSGLVAGQEIRVVISVRKNPFKAVHVNPELLIGTLWREQAPRIPGMRVKYTDHTITAVDAKWAMLKNRDLEPFEFDQIFDIKEPKLSWGDVALVAREYGITTDVAREMILQRCDPAAFAAAAAATAAGRTRHRAGMDVSGTVLDLISYQGSREQQGRAA